jgi:hypothetical protein
MPQDVTPMSEMRTATVPVLQVGLARGTTTVEVLQVGLTRVVLQHNNTRIPISFPVPTAVTSLLPRSDRHYCSITLQNFLVVLQHNNSRIPRSFPVPTTILRSITLPKLLRSCPSVRRRWLRRVKTARASFLLTLNTKQPAHRP